MEKTCNSSIEVYALNKYFNEGIRGLLNLKKTEYTKLGIDCSTEQDKLEGIYKFLGFTDSYDIENKPANNSFIMPFLKSLIELRVPLYSEEIDFIQHYATRNIIGAKEVYRIKDNLILSSTDVTKASVQKITAQMNELLNYIRTNRLCNFNDVENLHEQLTRVIKNEVEVIIGTTNISHIITPTKFKLFIPKHLQVPNMSMEDFIISRLYNIMTYGDTDFVPKYIKDLLINHLTKYNNLYNINLLEPQILYRIEILSRINSCTSPKDFLVNTLHIGDLTEINSYRCLYTGNVDRTATVFVGENSCVIESKYLAKILKDSNVYFIVKRTTKTKGKVSPVYLRNRTTNKEVTVWEYIFGKGTQPKDDNFNRILDSNIK